MKQSAFRDEGANGGLPAVAAEVHGWRMNEPRRKGGAMIRIRLQYDRYSGMFSLVDRELRSLLEDGAIYDLEFCLSLDDDDTENTTALDIGPLAHA
jgi:hypothetical protein